MNPGYFRPAFFFLAGLRACTLADFFFAGVFSATAGCFLADDRPLPKMLSQLSENFFVAPTRVTLMANEAPESKTEC